MIYSKTIRVRRHALRHVVSLSYMCTREGAISFSDINQSAIVSKLLLAWCEGSVGHTGCCDNQLPSMFPAAMLYIVCLQSGYGAWCDVPDLFRDLKCYLRSSHIY